MERSNSAVTAIIETTMGAAVVAPKQCHVHRSAIGHVLNVVIALNTGPIASWAHSYGNPHTCAQRRDCLAHMSAARLHCEAHKQSMPRRAHKR